MVLKSYTVMIEDPLSLDVTISHYSKSQIFVQIFKSKLSTTKSANPQHFHEFFIQNFFDNFSREIKVVNS